MNRLIRRKSFSKQASNNREPWTDALRGMGILIVVLGHTNPPFKSFIYGFHMPLFFMLSGYVWKEKKNTKEILINNIRRYVVPYCILCFFNLILSIFCFGAGWELTRKYLVGILYSRGTTKWMPNCSPLWFLTCIFVSITAFSYIMKLKRIYIVIIILCCCILSSVFSYFEIIKLPWNIDTALMGLIFILIGYDLKQRRVLGVFCELKLFVKISCIVTLLAVGSIAIKLNPVNEVNFDNNRYGNALLMIIGALSISLILFYIAWRIGDKWNGTIGRKISWLGQHTIFIMGFDFFSGSVAERLLGLVGLTNWLSIFMMKIIILCIGCVVWTLLVSMIPFEKMQKILSF